MEAVTCPTSWPGFDPAISRRRGLGLQTSGRRDARIKSGHDEAHPNAAGIRR